MPEAAFEFTFTVFTPTFQRATTLHRVYESLESQTFRNFEWLIVDDGSSDDTAVLVRAWQGKSSFPIRYVFQKNSGKHVAYNPSASLAKGQFLLALDSDDACVPGALERFRHWWESIPVEDRPRFSGVTVLCRDQEGQLVGTEFPTSPLDSDSIELHFKWGVKGEKWGFVRTDVLREFPFPEPEGVKFVAESLVWRRIAQKYKTRFVNEALRIYWINKEQNADNLSIVSTKVLRGRALHHLQTLNDLMGWFWRNPVAFFMAASNVSRYGFQLRFTPVKVLREVHSVGARILVTAMMPVGAAYALMDAARRRKANTLQATHSP
jgi:glycosyltransferase involved in cell wall biosynthesis